MNFYVLVNPKTGGSPAVTDFIPIKPVKLGEAPKCPKCGEVVGMLPLLPPARVEIELWGSYFGDIAFGPSNEILVSDEFRKIYLSNNLKGLSGCFPVEVVKVRPKKRPQNKQPAYLLAYIETSRATIDDARSELIRDKPWTCSECRLGGIIKRLSRIVLEEGSYPNEDIFFARGLPGTILVTERFRNACLESEMRNFNFIPALDYSFDRYPWEKSKS